MQTARTIPAEIGKPALGRNPQFRVSVLKALAYFDIFEYPLTAGEIAQFMDQQLTDEELNKLLAQLFNDGTLFRHQDLYSLRNNPELVQRRRNGNAMAEKLLVKAKRIGRFLQRFPFVRGVGISGSLSKNYAEKNADFDFFIITAANRLWIARTLMHIYKKFTFLLGRQHYYCMNYYLDEKALELRHQNIFTAIEAKTLLPVTGAPVMEKFLAANEWVNDWLPACQARSQDVYDKKVGWVKRMVEKILGSTMGEQLDNFLLRWTNHRWNKKRMKGKRNSKGQRMGLITGKHFAISNPGGFQEKLLAIYEQKLADLGLTP